MATILRVTFDEGYSCKRYDYIWEPKSWHDYEPKVGDKAVVKVSGLYKVTTIREITHGEEIRGFHKRVVSIVSLEEERRAEAERKAREVLAKRKQAIESKLTTLLGNNRERLLEFLALENFEVARLLDERAQLG